MCWKGNDFLFGDAGNDTEYGDAGADKIYGGGGADKLYGGADNDELHGGNGDDILVSIGGGDADQLFGDDGFDGFWYDNAENEKVMDESDKEIEFRHEHSVTNFHDYDINPFSFDTDIPASIHIAVGKEPTGGNFQDPVLTGAGSWKNFANQPLFPAAGPNPNDVQQGAVGDCWYGASISAMARKNPDRLKQSVVELGDGTYAARFFINGAEVYYRVDGDLPVDNSGNLMYLKQGGGGSIYTAILEKALAFARTGQGNYASLEGGHMDWAFSTMGVNNSGRFNWTEFKTGADLLSKIDQLDGEGKVIGFGTFEFLQTANAGPMVGKHAYSVVKVNKDANGKLVSVELRNPWGNDGVQNVSNYNDGYVTLNATQALNALQTLYWGMA